MRSSVAVCALTPASSDLAQRLRSAAAQRMRAAGRRFAQCDFGAIRGGQAIRLGRRVGADALQRDAVRARELRDDAAVRRVEPAAESGTARADQERHRRRRLARCAARATPAAARLRRARRRRACRRRRSRSCRSARPCPTWRRTRARDSRRSNGVRNESGVGQARHAAVAFQRAVERLEQVRQVRQRADVLAQRHETDAGDARHQVARRSPRGRAPRGTRRRDRASPRTGDRRPGRYSVPIFISAPMSARRVHLRHGQLVDRVLLRRETERARREEEQDVRPRDDGQDLRDLLLVLLEPRIGHAEQQVAVLSRHQAVAEQREHDLLRDVEPLGADLPALEVEQHFVARAEQVRDGLFVLRAAPPPAGSTRDESRRDCARSAHRPAPASQRASQLLGAMGGGVGVLGAGEAGRFGQDCSRTAARGRVEGRGVETVEGVVAARRADAAPRPVLDGAASARGGRARRRRRSSPAALLLDPRAARAR